MTVPFPTHKARRRAPDDDVVSALSLTKWYLDCVDDAGNLCIAYWARLAWRKLSISYSSTIVNRGGATQVREHFSGIASPALEGDGLTWLAPALGMEIAMKRRAPAYSESLIDGVAWRCEMPAADAAMLVHGEEIRGSGYAEMIQLDVPPWKLPIDELRWGRFSGPDLSLTWIEWRGSHPLTRTLVNGVRTGDGSVGDHVILAGDYSLTISDRRVIRDATLGETLSILALPLPKRIAAAREVKWCGRGTATRGNGVASTGWVIYESVKFA